MCPVCTEKGLTSLTRTQPFDPSKEAAPMEYWDDGEKLHVHDSNMRQRRYRCTNGHDMLLMAYDKCPSCEYNEGRTELMVENPETNTVAKYRFTKQKQWKKVVTFDAG